MAKKKFSHFVEELDEKFNSIHKKISKARDDYLKRHEKDLEKAKKKVDKLKGKFNKAKDKAAKAAAEVKVSGSKAAQNEWKKTKAAASLLSASLKEAMGIMKTAEEKLHSAKPFDKKLAAREKALQAFEKEWAKKVEAEEKQKAKRAAVRKSKSKSKSKSKTTSAKAPPAEKVES